jgi:SNF2 family DNA or RNA helicase
MGLYQQESLGISNSTMLPAPEVHSLSQGLTVTVREARLLNDAPWVRTMGIFGQEVSTAGWRFPAPPDERAPIAGAGAIAPVQTNRHLEIQEPKAKSKKKWTRLRPPSDAAVFMDRLLYLLQPPLENLFAAKQIRLRCQPYSYQFEGMAFLMPRKAALLADEMGLGKTMQTILSLRLMFHGGLIRNALVVCPKALVSNWARELRIWGEDVPFEMIAGDSELRRTGWLVSNCPIKLVNYELLTRDATCVADARVAFDVVVLDEAQRIKNRESKTARVVRSIRRDRSWALTGTPIENRPEDLVNIFAFVDPDRIPQETPVKRLPQLTGDCILRRTKDEVLADLPPKTIRDAYLDLTSSQRAAYEIAETEGVVRLNSLGSTITIQHIFDLIMRLKQICNFDPLTGQSAKREQLQADLHEVAESGRKAIVFSQWVEPLEYLAKALQELGPLLYHGKVPQKQRQLILERFHQDAAKHVLLMSYGTGSVGLNLQFANYVFLFDRWWNPAVEDQAINRAHRIGQRNPVIVTRFIMQNTIEERIAEVLDRKRQLFNELIEQNSPPPSLGLTEDEIFNLFDIQARPKRAAA